MTKKEILSNGLTVITESVPHVRSVTVGIWLRRGSRHEDASECGIAHFVEHMVFKGTRDRSQAQIAQELDAMGGHSDAFTTKEYASFHATVVDEHLPRVMDLLADIVLHPRFDDEELERERQVIFEELSMAEDTHDDLAHELFVQSFWPDHPLGRPILGTRQTVGSLTRDDILQFFRAAYTPENLIVAAAGNLEHGKVVELVRDYFEPLERRPDGFVESAPRVEFTICSRNKDLEQVHLVMGTVAPPHNHANRYTSYVLNTVFGGTMSSRLFQIIREDRGLVYSVFSGLTSYRDAGTLTIYAGTSPKNMTRVIDLVMEELRRITKDPVTEDELRRAKDHLKGNIVLGLESTSARMSQLARHEMYFSRHIPPEEILDGIERVSRDDVLRLAVEMIDGRTLGLTAVGNLTHFQPSREMLMA